MSNLIEGVVTEKKVINIMSCKDCQFCWVGELERETLKRKYFCRRFPPTTLLVPNGSLSVFPAVLPEMWCGEWMHRKVEDEEKQ